MGKMIGKVLATEKNPSTMEEFYFWTKPKLILNPFDPYTFVALVDRVVIGQDRKLEFIFRNGMKYEYTIVG